MIVYHGTNQDIDSIDLKKGSRYKDFGQGFYVTPNLETAKRMAYKKVKFFKGTPTVIEYDFDESSLSSKEIASIVFPEKATADWIRFVNMNRENRKSSNLHDYDIIQGPIADDGVALQLGRLRINPEAADDISKALQDKYLDQQIYFGTSRSLTYLKKRRTCQL